MIYSEILNDPYTANLADNYNAIKRTNTAEQYAESLGRDLGGFAQMAYIINTLRKLQKGGKEAVKDTVKSKNPVKAMGRFVPYIGFL